MGRDDFDAERTRGCGSAVLGWRDYQQIGSRFEPGGIYVEPHEAVGFRLQLCDVADLRNGAIGLDPGKGNAIGRRRHLGARAELDRARLRRQLDYRVISG